MNFLNYCKQSILFLFLITSTFQLSAQNVWPGDVNRNGIVNHVDLLHTGWAFGAVGEPREAQGSAWESYPVPSSEWSNQFPNGDNFYYADANGDGVVNNTDIDIITSLNYNLTQGELGPEGYLNADPGSDNPALYFELAANEVFIGEPIQIDLFLGDANTPIDDFHGIALDISYESEHNSTFSSVEYAPDPSSWLEVDNETINFENHDAANKRIDFALSRLSGSNIDGQGKIGSFIIIVEDIVLNVEADTINFTIENVKFVGADFETFPIIPASTQFVVKRPNCDFNVEINQQSCSEYELFTTGEELLDWFVNDEFQSTGLEYDFTATNSGTYQICVVNEGCPPETNFCETFVISEDCFGDCEVGITINEIDCDTYVISESSGQQVSWFINDEFVSFFHGIDFDPTEAGTYEICAGIETPDCPQGVFACETIVVSPDCFEDDCAFDVEINEQSCSAYELFTTGEELLDWYVNDEFQLTGLAYDLIATNAGTYQICVVNEGCPPETNFCETFVISEDCFGDCEVVITINEIDCDTYVISESSGQQVSWFINDEFVSFFHGIDFDPTEAGTYEICAGIETPDCPQGVLVCETIVVSPDCFGDCEVGITINEIDCDTYVISESSGQQVSWYINDEFVSFFHGIDFDPTEAGTYEICAGIETPDCPQGVLVCETIVVSPDCFGDCAVGITINEIDCDTYVISESSGQQVSWYINDEFVSFFHGIDFDPTEAGTYEICAGIETPDCPQGVFVCETIVVSPDCFEDDCAFNVEINEQSCSEYELFTTGEELLDWYVNDVFQLTGLEYDFVATNAGTYEICVVNEGCPPETNFCETFVISEDCFEDDCAFDVEINQQSCSEYELFTPGEEQLDWFLNDEFQSTGLGYDFVASEAGTYEICVVNEGCPPETNFCETFVISEDCFETVNIDMTLQDREIIIRPTITKSDFRIEGLSGNCTIEIIDQNGKSVFQKIVNGDTETNCDISHLLPGLYYISILNTENKLKRISRIVKM